MADAKKCDICGKYFSLYFTGNERPSLCGIYVDGIKIMSFKHQEVLGCYDICETCAKDLLSFIKHEDMEGDNEQ